MKYKYNGIIYLTASKAAQATIESGDADNYFPTYIERRFTTYGLFLKFMAGTETTETIFKEFYAGWVRTAELLANAGSVTKLKERYHIETIS